MARSRNPSARRDAGPLRAPYEALKRQARVDYGGHETGRLILDLVRVSLAYLNGEAAPIELVSRVPAKDYISYALKTAPQLPSSPINRDFFNPNYEEIESSWIRWEVGKPTAGLATLIYTMACCFRAASELFDRGNKKGPATYFEVLVGHLFARVLGVNPTKTVTIPIEGRRVRLTMDFLFNLSEGQASRGKGQPHVHLPVKLSTRERVVQAWSH